MPFCYFDHLQLVYTENETTFAISEPLCGRKTVKFPIYRINKPEVEIKFITDASVERVQGFELTYQKIESELENTLNCTFDKGLDFCPGWEIDETSDFRFHLTNGPTPSLDSGPEYDNTNYTITGMYAYAETSLPSKTGQKAVLSSPKVSFKVMRTHCVEFWYHKSANSGRLLVENTVTKDFIEISQAHKNWTLAKFEFEASEIQLNFTVIHEGNANSDIAIDDIEHYFGECKYFDNTCRPHYSKGNFIFKVGKRFFG